ncbi:Fatty acyl-CoA reductase [Prochlorococcus marinus str. MIT 1342]|uniref:SDR family NAD(P)-dependent oxidoreductase n=1 Tax=Prochlorococcus TaxID=1218 RepID=UPI0007B37088|nr:SDR family NAD(P)-dependent oxidoreductase [Prochlorococcus marinus]KZR81462.1 Fatty acyl-CoA reductase [Prochlorococcus marinus str. MIT 1342]
MTKAPSSTVQSRRILLTGASSGIGYQAAVQMHRAGHQLILPCRDRSTATATLKKLSEETVQHQQERSPVSAPVMDLADLESIKQCADDLLSIGQPIDTLILNAGLQYTGAAKAQLSSQGYELTIAVNHLGHQALSIRLLPLLDAGMSPRVVVTASEVHDSNSPGGRFGKPAGLGDLTGLKTGAGFEMIDGSSSFNADKAYKDSKLCNVLFARELARRLSLRSIQIPVLAWAPGLVIPRSSGGFFRYSRRYNEWGQRVFSLVVRDLLRISESAENAGSLLSRLATDQSLNTSPFSYRSNRLDGPGQHRFEEANVSKEAQDNKLAKSLWEVSAELIGLPTELPPASVSQC